ncbi:MAG: DUF5420 family protein [Desulfovibrio sp.]|jgi:hypothetical protein|nr:DUF5420 family protein [Desulfovibrio sp.]
MKYTYFVGDGPEAKAVIDAARDKENAFREAVIEFEASLPRGVKCWIRGGRFGTGIVGFGFPRPLTLEKMRALGLKEGDSLPDNGKLVRTYVPDRRFSKGKEMQKRIDAVNGKYANFSQEVLKILNISYMWRDLYNIYCSAAGSKDGKLFVRMPGSPEDEGDGFWNEFPEVPSWFRAPQEDEATFFLK